MDQPTDEFEILALALVLLAAAVISVPIARRVGLSAIVAYLIAGIVIGPFGLAIFRTPGSILSVAMMLRLTLNRPERMNAWGGGMAGGFWSCLDRAESERTLLRVWHS